MAYFIERLYTKPARPPCQGRRERPNADGCKTRSQGGRARIYQSHKEEQRKAQEIVEV